MAALSGLIGTVAPSPAIVPGAIPSGGSESFPREVIARVVRQHVSQVRGCYERALASNPGLAGRFTLQFSIGGNGAVTSANIVERQPAGAALSQCITAAVLGWSFPPPGHSVTVNYPFVFTQR